MEKWKSWKSIGMINKEEYNESALCNLHFDLHLEIVNLSPNQTSSQEDNLQIL